MYRFGDDESIGLRLVNNITSSSTVLFPSKDSLLDHWDRNADIANEFLASFVECNSIYRWNLEEDKGSIEITLDNDQSDNANNLINLQWAKSLNPFLFYYGTHNEIFIGDFRENMDGSKKASLSIQKVQNCFHFRDKAELFQSFVINPVEPHQLVTSSDFNINFLDIRYPNKNVSVKCAIGNLIKCNRNHFSLLDFSMQAHVYE